MDTNKSYLKVIIVQNNPVYKDINQNIKYLTETLKDFSEKDKIDILLFTEMALTGYFFDSKEDIEPYTSYCNKGETFEFCSNMSKKLNCYTFLGYPEKTEDSNFYNSLMITDREGNLIKSYHKKNLFKDDKKWCTPGKEFEYIDILTNCGKTARLALGICLDYYYSSKFMFQYEYAKFFRNKNINFFIFPTNWADHEHQDNSKENIFRSIKNNWLDPLTPIFNEAEKRNIYLLAADRTGIERNVYLLGCSCIVKLGMGCKILEYLDKNTNGIIVKELEF
jgi:protein N-terminal amidase